MTLDRALDRLIFERSYRHAFLRGDVETLGLDSADRAALGTIDPGVLASLAERVARQTLARRHAGSGSLPDVYPRCFEAWRRSHPEDASLLELAFQFQDSTAFRAYRDHPFSGVGASIEECFFFFAELVGLAQPAVRENEFLAAMIKLLASSPRARFHLPGAIRRVEEGYFAVSTRGAPTLYAAVRGRYVTGPLTPFLRELLALGADPRRVAEQHAVPEPVLTQALARLSALGLAPTSSNSSA